MDSLVFMLIGVIIGYGIGRFVEVRKNAKEKRDLMLELGNTNDNARNRADKRWNM